MQTVDNAMPTFDNAIHFTSMHSNDAVLFCRMESKQEIIPLRRHGKMWLNVTDEVSEYPRIPLDTMTCTGPMEKVILAVERKCHPIMLASISSLRLNQMSLKSMVRVMRLLDPENIEVLHINYGVSDALEHYAESRAEFYSELNKYCLVEFSPNLPLCTDSNIWDHYLRTDRLRTLLSCGCIPHCSSWSRYIALQRLSVERLITLSIDLLKLIYGLPNKRQTGTRLRLVVRFGSSLKAKDFPLTHAEWSMIDYSLIMATRDPELLSAQLAQRFQVNICEKSAIVELLVCYKNCKSRLSVLPEVFFRVLRSFLYT